jgi:hypothetical protein
MAFKPPRLGATGDFPRGKLNADDEGGLILAITVIDQTLRIEFGKPIAWLAMSRDEAIGFAELIMQRAQSM